MTDLNNLDLSRVLRDIGANRFQPVRLGKIQNTAIEVVFSKKKENEVCEWINENVTGEFAVDLMWGQMDGDSGELVRYYFVSEQDAEAVRKLTQ